VLQSTDRKNEITRQEITRTIRHYLRIPNSCKVLAD
jgi:hypothetical protein